MDRVPYAKLAREAVEQVRVWLEAARRHPADRSGRTLAGVLSDPDGLSFSAGFIDGVVRPEDVRVAGDNLRRVSHLIPSFLPAYMRRGLALGARVSSSLPAPVVLAARRIIRSLASHLIIDARDGRLTAALAKLKKAGVELNLNLLGEAILGSAEASKRLLGTMALLNREDVDYVSIKVSSAVEPHSPWAFTENVDYVVEQLEPLYDQALLAPGSKFINLDMEEYRDLDLTLAVFKAVLDKSKFLSLPAGIVLQSYLPDSLGAYTQLLDWSKRRVDRGGAPIKARLVKGANLPMERVEAALHGWPLATWSTKRQTDTQYKRILDLALRPENIGAVRLGVAGHNLFDLAFAWLLSGQRQVREGLEFEMLLGMAPAQAQAVLDTVGKLRLYTPVVRPDEFDVAIAYLVRRLEEGASQENFMSAVFELESNEDLFLREENRFLAAVAGLEEEPVSSFRQALIKPQIEGFYNTPNTDPSSTSARRAGVLAVKRASASSLGDEALGTFRISGSEELSALIGAGVKAASDWTGLGAVGRGEILRNAAELMESCRFDLLEVMASEAGKTLEQSDPEVSEAIDFAKYYADRALDLERVSGAKFRSVKLTVVIPPWNFPVAIPAGGVLAALACGSAVILKPSSLAVRCGAVMAECLWSAGVPKEVLQLVVLEDAQLRRELVTDPAIERVILTGSYETAERFLSWRSTLGLLGETSGKNALVITPSADIDLAVRDLIQSAFGHAGQKCSAASLGILVGSVAKSRRFRRQLIDGVCSLRVGWSTDIETQMGPLIKPAEGKLLRALTQLDEGEEWLVEPNPLDKTGKLWSPGVKIGVRPGSEFHLTEYFGPVLGLMQAKDLDQAIAWQNAVDYGLTAGIHTLNSFEIKTWMDRVEAGNLYVNRGITGAIVRRQPFGGWKKSSVGPGAKAGGPNYLLALVDWSRNRGGNPRNIQLAPELAGILKESALGFSTAELDFMKRSWADDQKLWRQEYSQSKDVSGLEVEKNIFRYLPEAATVIAGPQARLVDVVRVLGAGWLTGAPVTLILDKPLPRVLSQILESWKVQVIVVAHERLSETLAALRPGRIRLIGMSLAELFARINPLPTQAVYAQPVTESGRLELLAFLKEQAVSVTAHRFGLPYTPVQKLFG